MTAATYRNTTISKLHGSLHANASFTIVVEIASNLSTQYVNG
jgi:hypothetical protein